MAGSLTLCESIRTPVLRLSTTKMFEHSSSHLRDSPLDGGLRDLVEIRVSQMTGCAFCLSLHTGIARRRGVSDAALDTLAGWRESPAFTPKERSALDLAEAMTRIGGGMRVDDEVWSTAREAFDDKELVALLYLIGLIAWSIMAIRKRDT